jgi:hypothetical protein
MDRQTDRQTNILTGGRAYGRTDGRTDRLTDRLTEGQTDRDYINAQFNIKIALFRRKMTQSYFPATLYFKKNWPGRDTNQGSLSLFSFIISHFTTLLQRLYLTLAPPHKNSLQLGSTMS